MMDVLVCADEVTNPKPHPEPVEKALALLGAEPATAVYVGDSIHDMVSGRAAGVRTAAALWGPFGREHLAGATPDYWLETPGDLLGLLETLGCVAAATMPSASRSPASRPGSRASAGSAAPR